MKNGKEFYKVELRSSKYRGEEESLYVIARSIGQAEKRAVAVARSNGNFSNKQSIFALSAEFVGYIA